jgi:hypothetical protein
MFNGIRVSGLIGITASFGFALLLGFSSPLKAETLSDNKAIVTFDRPVEVPGKVLPPGSYVFKSLNHDELVQVFSADERQLFATIAVIPEDRPAASIDTDCFVQLTRSRADAPQEVEGYFLPGRLTGFQFVYPAAHASHHRL